MDDLVFPDGRTRMGQPGGAALYASLGAAMFGLPTGLSSLKGTDYPRAALDALFHFYEQVSSTYMRREVVRALGWPELCGADQKGMIANRARFIEAYDGIARQGRKNAQASLGAVAPKLQLSSRGPVRQLEERRGAPLALKDLIHDVAPEDDGESGEES